jgi:hypothetical protein
MHFELIRLNCLVEKLNILRQHSHKKFCIKNGISVTVSLKSFFCLVLHMNINNFMFLKELCHQKEEIIHAKS